MAESNITYICTACGWVYDPEQGDPDGDIPPGTPWEQIPDDWVCPVCGAGKEDFEPVEVPRQVSKQEVPDSKPTVESTQPPLVIIGSGLAGYSLAKELRNRDLNLPITVLTTDGGEVYTKPMLSNALARHHRPDDMVQKQADELAKELGMVIRTRTRVLAIDRDSRNLTLESDTGEDTLNYDRLVLALGADPRIFPAEGSEHVEISTVNDLDDYRRWRQRIGQKGRILLIGAGLIGCEFANDLAGAGFDVSMVDPSAWPLARLLPQEIGEMLTSALQGIGCILHLGHTVACYRITEKGAVAELDDGSQIPFDHALSAVGLTPRTALAKQAGLEVQHGIIVDRLLRTSDPYVFALGDCAQTEAGPLPFIAPLLAEARALTATLCGEETSLHLPAMPVIVKTPALPLVVCPPSPGTEGSWELELGEDEAMALFRTADGAEVGFVLAGHKTNQQQAMSKRMPDLLPATEEIAPASDTTETASNYACNVCGYVYDPAKGDPDGGIPPGTPWEAIPDDWVCPTCGAGKEEFSPVT